MDTLLTSIHIPDGTISRNSLEVLSRCRQLADEKNLVTSALLIGPEAGKHAGTAARYGASRICLVEDPVFRLNHNTPLLTALTAAANHLRPGVIAFASSESSKDLLGALAVSLDAPALPDLSHFELKENGVKGKRPVMAGNVIASVEAVGNPVIVSVRSGSYERVENPVEPETEKIEVRVDSDEIKPALREVIAAAGDRIDLSEAEIIIAAGRGVKDEAGTALISELANLLHAGVGASRALTETGVYDPSLQIGQTGKVVSPQLYIAVGISGAIQHVAGMNGSRVIVAINRDPDAPIFEIADYGIVGDLYKVLPPFIEEIRRLKSGQGSGE